MSKTLAKLERAKVPPSPRRIDSMDQFRGYTVAGMFVVNFLGGMTAIHAVMKHNNTYFSYADSIMPSFMFAVGFSFRLTYLRRRTQQSAGKTALTYVKRSLALVVVSLVMYGFGIDLRGPDGKGFDAMPEEYRSSRPIAPRTRAFEYLVKKAREANPTADERAIIAEASRVGRDAESPTGKEAARIASEEIQSYIAPAVERQKTWDKMGRYGHDLVHWRILLAKLLKSDLWETLAIIGVTQLVVLPWIGCSFGIRFLAMIGLGLLHLLISYWFNWDFVYGVFDNWMSNLWWTGTNRSWDGGFFGPIGWAVAMMAGTLAHDMVFGAPTHAAAAARLVIWGVAFMAIGYGMSCLTRLYELSGEELVAFQDRMVQQEAEKSWLRELVRRQETPLARLRRPINELKRAVKIENRKNLRALQDELRQRPEYHGYSSDKIASLAEQAQRDNARPNARLAELEKKLQAADARDGAEIDRMDGTITVLKDQQQRYPSPDLAESAVLPPFERAKGRSLWGLFAEPPFVAPSVDDPQVGTARAMPLRQLNYWMMGKRMPSLSFMTFSTGFAFALYGFFVLACDIGGCSVGIFRTFGMNALAAYFLHHVVELAVHPLVPRDATLVQCLAGFSLFFFLTYVCVRFLEKRNIYVKL